jgi:ubiquinone/menaquinone biosynthesis C-methylase UbiE
LSACDVLEVGCGSGGGLRTLLALGATPARVCGVDLLPDRIAEARKAFPECRLAVGNAEHLEYSSQSFDLVVAFTVFSSILSDEMARNLASEISRVLRPGGDMLWFDFRVNNPWNKQVRGVSRRQLRSLFPGFKGSLVSICLLPPLARRLGRWTAMLYPVLAGLPFLRTHWLGLLTKPPAAESVVG